MSTITSSTQPGIAPTQVAAKKARTAYSPIVNASHSRKGSQGSR